MAGNTHRSSKTSATFVRIKEMKENIDKRAIFSSATWPEKTHRSSKTSASFVRIKETKENR